MDHSAEITRQLRILKKRLDEDAADREQKSNIILDEIKRDLKGIHNEVRELAKQIDSLKKNQKEIDDSLYQMHTEKPNELAIGNIESRVYNKIVSDINTKVLPKMTSLAEYMHYIHDDPMETINKYRYSLDKSARTPQIGSGNEGPRLFFK